jgi:hypothetical protein
VSNAEQMSGLLNLLLYFRIGYASHPKAETQVLRYGHVRIKGVVLKDHGHVPFSWRKVIHRLPAQQDRPLILAIQPGHDL